MKLSYYLLGLACSDRYKPEFMRPHGTTFKRGYDMNFMCPFLNHEVLDGNLSRVSADLLRRRIERKLRATGVTTLINHLVKTLGIQHHKITVEHCRDWWQGFALAMENEGL
jgi:hypothetical protein